MKTFLIILGFGVAGVVGFAVGRATGSKFPFLPFGLVRAPEHDGVGRLA